MTKKAPPSRRYTIEIDDATVDALIAGRCPEALSVRAHGLLAWQRRAIRALTPERRRRRRKAKVTR